VLWELGRERLDTHPLSKIPGYATAAKFNCALASVKLNALSHKPQFILLFKCSTAFQVCTANDYTNKKLEKFLSSRVSTLVSLTHLSLLKIIQPQSGKKQLHKTKCYKWQNCTQTTPVWSLLKTNSRELQNILLEYAIYIFKHANITKKYKQTKSRNILTMQQTSSNSVHTTHNFHYFKNVLRPVFTVIIIRPVILVEINLALIKIILFIQAISIAPLQVLYDSDALLTQHGYCADFTPKHHRQL